MLLNLFIWNCQGCADPKFVRVVRDNLAEFKVAIAVFFETRISSTKADDIIAKIGMD